MPSAERQNPPERCVNTAPATPLWVRALAAALKPELIKSAVWTARVLSTPSRAFIATLFYGETVDWETLVDLCAMSSGQKAAYLAASTGRTYRTTVGWLGYSENKRGGTAGQI